MAASASLVSIASLFRNHAADQKLENAVERSIKDIDLQSLAHDLSTRIEGEVRFDRASIGLYATDASNFREIPLGVVIPRTEEDVIAAHRICSHYGAPIVSRGTGTSLSGETVNFAVVIDHSK